MELKHEDIMSFTGSERLLIVPYGIETQFNDPTKKGMTLLIVPYGIETKDKPAAPAPSASF